VKTKYIPKGLIMNDLMIDIETLSNKKDAVITQIGACFFNRFTGEIGETFLYNVSINSSLKIGLKVNGETIKWWLERSELITWLNNTKELSWVLANLREFYYKNKECNIWCHVSFDIPILESAYNLLGQKLPFNFRKIRDLRTLVDIAGIIYNDTPKEGDPKTHNALNDCLFQVGYTVKGINRIMVKE